MTTAQVQVLMSTYNGEQYLRCQIDSIINQDYPNISILIRDDGSTDRTVSIIKEYMDEYSNINLIEGNNIGVVASFMELLKCSCQNADFISFCDQDDFWYKEKISRAVNMLKSEKGNATLYFSALDVVDSSLNHPKKLFLGGVLNINNALVQNVATGCTIVINREMRRNILFETRVEDIQMHDWWFYLVALTTGTVLADPEPSMAYRQHLGNVVGMPSNPLKLFRKIKAVYREVSSGIITQQAKLLLSIHKENISSNDIEIIEGFVDRGKSIIKRFGCAFSGLVFRQSFLQNQVLRVLIILNRV